VTQAIKYSGVGWIEEIPPEWKNERVKSVFQEVSIKGFPSAPLLAATQHAGVILKSEVGWRTMEAKVDGRENFKLVCEDDFVISLRSFEGGIEKSSVRGIISPAYTVLRLRDAKRCEPEYFKHFFKSATFLAQLKQHQKGIRDGQAIPFSTLEYDFIAVPPFAEQRAIADYLDRQTALIDQRLSTLAEKKTVLAELRKATIHDAVTKGLNKNAPMKDSGVAWIGEIPKNWEIKRLKSLLKEPLTYGANEAADSNDLENPRFVRITDIDANGNLREDTFRSLPLDIARQYLLKEGDVLLARSGATVGKSFIYQRSWGRCCFAGYLIRARLNPDVCVPKFFYACCQSTFYWQYISDTQIQSTIQNVNAEKYANLYLPCPPVDEQLTIAHHLDQQTQHIDAQLATLDEQAQVLKELRKAIIHEAVTGKIDLSGT